MRLRLSILLILPLLYALPANLSAGTVRMESTIITRATDGRVHARVILTNSGDEPAKNILLTTEAFGQKRTSPIKGLLKPGQSLDFEAYIPLPPGSSGRFPVKLLFRYQDLKGRPLSGVTVSTVLIGKEIDPGIVADGNPCTVEDEAGLIFTAGNLTNTPLQVRASLTIPEEFYSERPVLDFLLPGKSRKQLSFSVKNIAGLPGSIYPVFATFEFDKDRRHQTVVAETPVSIKKRRVTAKKFTNELLFFSLLLFLFFILFAAKKRR